MIYVYHDLIVQGYGRVWLVVLRRGDVVVRGGVLEYVGIHLSAFAWCTRRLSSCVIVTLLLLFGSSIVCCIKVISHILSLSHLSLL